MTSEHDQSGLVKSTANDLKINKQQFNKILTVRHKIIKLFKKGKLKKKTEKNKEKSEKKKNIDIGVFGDTRCPSNKYKNSRTTSY